MSGNAVLSFAWAGLMLLACASGPAFAEPSIAAGPTPEAGAQCELKRAASLDMIAQPDGEIAVPVSIADQKVSMLVDTGSVESSISSDLARQLNLKPKVGAAQMMAGGVPVFLYAPVKSFEIGGLRSQPDFNFYIVPATAIAENISGMLGPDVMKQFDVEFDFADGKFNIFSQDHCASQVVYWTRDAYAEVPITVDRESHITVPVTLEGRTLTAMVDTGAETSLMTLPVLKKLLGIDENNPNLKSLGDFSINGNAPTTRYHYPFHSLTFEGIAVSNPDIVIVSDDGMGDQDVNLVIGMGILRQLRVYVAYREQKLFLTRAEAR